MMPLTLHFARELPVKRAASQGRGLQLQCARAGPGKKRRGSRGQKARWQVMRTQG